MKNPLMIGVAVACLAAVAALIAIDQGNISKADPGASAPVILSSNPGIQTAVPAQIPVVASKPEDATICPAVAPAAPKEAPAVTAAPAPAPAPTPAKKVLIETLPGGERIYTVVQGDTLYGISVKVFNTPRHYERIYEANRDRIADPNTLQLGMKLALPDVPSSKELQ